jgi:hypothetical protein
MDLNQSHGTLNLAKGNIHETLIDLVRERFAGGRGNLIERMSECFD